MDWTGLDWTGEKRRGEERSGEERSGEEYKSYNAVITVIASVLFHSTTLPVGEMTRRQLKKLKVTDLLKRTQT